MTPKIMNLSMAIENKRGGKNDIPMNLTRPCPCGFVTSFSVCHLYNINVPRQLNQLVLTESIT